MSDACRMSEIQERPLSRPQSRPANSSNQKSRISSVSSKGSSRRAFQLKSNEKKKFFDSIKKIEKYRLINIGKDETKE